jgi:Rod binding domain-containing protein
MPISGARDADLPGSSLNAPDLYSLARMGNTKKGLKAAAREFESLLLNEMLKSMRKTVEKNPLFHGGSAEDMFEDMYYQELSRTLAQSGGIGLAKIIYDQLASRLPDDQESATIGTA